MILSAEASGETHAASTFRLTRALLERGLSSDLGNSDADRREFQRRASEVALLLHAAGVPVKIEI